MTRGVLLRRPSSGWAISTFAGLYPGAYAVVFGDFHIPLEAEDAGFEVRDCLLALGTGVVHRIWLLRKPCSEATVAAQVLLTGTGALWIDGCRVASSGDHKRPFQPCRFDRDTYWKKQTPFQPTNAEGRWPSNLLLVHMPGCILVGTREDDVSTPVAFVAGSDKAKAVSYYGDGLNDKDHENRTTSVDVWACEPGCLVEVLEKQSLAGGMHPAGSPRGYKPSEVKPGYSGGWTKDQPYGGLRHGDSGGASRFFPQFGSEEDLDGWLTRLLLGPE